MFIYHIYIVINKYHLLEKRSSIQNVPFLIHWRLHGITFLSAIGNTTSGWGKIGCVPFLPQVFPVFYPQIVG